MQYLPRFDSDFLNDFTNAFRKRSKAWKHYTRDLSIDRCLVQLENGMHERMEANFSISWSDFPMYVDVLLWDDRWSELYFFCQPLGKKKIWERTIVGRLLPTCTPRIFVDNLERSNLGPDEAEAVNELDSLWREHIASGPAALKN